MMDSQMKQIVRERQTEERIRAMDATEIVDKIHALEDRIAELETESGYAKIIARDRWDVIQKMEQSIEAALKLADNPEWQGYTEYVRADKLREALATKPDTK